jgi:hypothetical protein
VLEVTNIGYSLNIGVLLPVVCNFTILVLIAQYWNTILDEMRDFCIPTSIPTSKANIIEIGLKVDPSNLNTNDLLKLEEVIEVGIGIG